ncbi:MAG: type II secretion system F family protein [Candidatus Omnitrophica bacterium]|nr:type II secretion system F family protein [Candidatus Omnitrophota bacterium]
MLTFAMIAVFACIGLLVIGLSPAAKTERPSLNLKDLGVANAGMPTRTERKKIDPLFFLNAFSIMLKPIIAMEMRRRLVRDLAIAQSPLTPETFMLIKILVVGGLLFVLPGLLPSDMMIFSILMCVAAGYVGPEMFLRGQIAKIKDEMVRLLPDTVDLLGLCVNAGLDFMMALKWVVDKSANSVVIREMDNILQEISVGKPRREALRDMARKYELPDLSTFARTLIQADKMGTSVSEALSILSEDMRLARFRRGEAMALKAPLKMLVPLLFCIFPVVFILVGAPIFLDFVMNNPIKGMGN